MSDTMYWNAVEAFGDHLHDLGVELLSAAGDPDRLARALVAAARLPHLAPATSDDRRLAELAAECAGAARRALALSDGRPMVIGVDVARSAVAAFDASARIAELAEAC